MSENKYIECGKVVNTHGCHGGIKLESWCNTPEDLASLKRFFIEDTNGYIQYKVKKSSIFKQFVLVLVKKKYFTALQLMLTNGLPHP